MGKELIISLFVLILVLPFVSAYLNVDLRGKIVSIVNINGTGTGDGNSSRCPTGFFEISGAGCVLNTTIGGAGGVNTFENNATIFGNYSNLWLEASNQSTFNSTYDAGLDTFAFNVTDGFLSYNFTFLNGTNLSASYLTINKPSDPTKNMNFRTDGTGVDIQSQGGTEGFFINYAGPVGIPGSKAENVTIGGNSQSDNSVVWLSPFVNSSSQFSKLVIGYPWGKVTGYKVGISGSVGINGSTQINGTLNVTNNITAFGYCNSTNCYTIDDFISGGGTLDISWSNNFSISQANPTHAVNITANDTLLCNGLPCFTKTTADTLYWDISKGSQNNTYDKLISVYNGTNDSLNGQLQWNNTFLSAGQIFMNFLQRTADQHLNTTSEVQFSFFQVNNGNISNQLNASNITAIRNISAQYFQGSGKYLTDLPSGTETDPIYQGNASGSQFIGNISTTYGNFSQNINVTNNAYMTKLCFNALCTLNFTTKGTAICINGGC